MALEGVIFRHALFLEYLLDRPLIFSACFRVSLYTLKILSVVRR